MSALIWLALALGFVAGILAGLARIAWEAAREGYHRGYVRIVGVAQAIEDDNE